MINFVHDVILKNQLGEKTSQESFQKVFKPVTPKLDDVALGRLRLPALPRKRNKKDNIVAPDYGSAIEDEGIPDYASDDLFDGEEIQPGVNKQLVPKPPTYEESLADKLKDDKQIYVDP